MNVFIETVCLKTWFEIYQYRNASTGTILNLFGEALRSLSGEYRHSGTSDMWYTVSFELLCVVLSKCGLYVSGLREQVNKAKRFHG